MYKHFFIRISMWKISNCSLLPSKPPPPKAKSQGGKSGSAGGKSGSQLPARPGPGHPVYHHMVNVPHGLASHDYDAQVDDELSFKVSLNFLYKFICSVSVFEEKKARYCYHCVVGNCGIAFMHKLSFFKQTSFCISLRFYYCTSFDSCFKHTWK